MTSYELRRKLARYFATKGTAAADRIWDEQGLSDEDMTDWLEDVAMAERVLAEPDKRFTLEEVEQELGLAD